MKHRPKSHMKNQWNKKLVLWKKISKIDELLANLTKIRR
jgi:hypothetical protein